MTTMRTAMLDLPEGNAMRAPGEAPGMMALEIAIDEMAEKLGSDPIAFRIFNDTDDPIPAGGLLSTGADVSRFYRMLLSGGQFDGKRILAADTVKEMTRVQTGDLKAGFTPGTGWGLGIGVVREPEDVTAMLSPGSFGHGGAFGTQSWADPKRDLFVILLIQRTGLKNSDASAMRKELQQLAVDAIKE